MLLVNQGRYFAYLSMFSILSPAEFGKGKIKVILLLVWVNCVKRDTMAANKTIRCLMALLGLQLRARRVAD